MFYVMLKNERRRGPPWWDLGVQVSLCSSTVRRQCCSSTSLHVKTFIVVYSFHPLLLSGSGHPKRRSRTGGPGSGRLEESRPL